MNQRDDLLRTTNELATAVYSTGARIERERIIELLHRYIATGDPALIKGVDKAITLIEQGTSCSKCSDCC